MQSHSALLRPPPARSCCTLDSSLHDLWAAWTAAGCLAFALALAASGRLMYTTWRRRKVRFPPNCRRSGGTCWLQPTRPQLCSSRVRPRPPTHALLAPVQAAKAGQELPLGAAALWHDDGTGGGGTSAGLGKAASMPVSKGAAYQAPSQEQFAVSPRIEAVHGSLPSAYARA